MERNTSCKGQKDITFMKVKKGEVLATLYINDKSDCSEINNIFDIK